MGNVSGAPIFQNDQGVVVHGTRSIKLAYDMSVSSHSSILKMTLKGCVKHADVSAKG